MNTVLQQPAGEAGRRRPASRALYLVDTALQRLLAVLCVALVALMLGTVCGQVVMRYGFNSPLSWSEELARFAMIWMAFGAAALAFRHGTHIKLEGVRVVPARFAGAGAQAVKTVVVVILLALVYFGWQITMKTASQHSPALGLPMAAVYFSIPFSAACMLYFALLGWWLAPLPEPAAASATAAPAQ